MGSISVLRVEALGCFSASGSKGSGRVLGLGVTKMEIFESFRDAVMQRMFGAGRVWDTTD